MDELRNRSRLSKFPSDSITNKVPTAPRYPGWSLFSGKKVHVVVRIDGVGIDEQAACEIGDYPWSHEFALVRGGGALGVRFKVSRLIGALLCRWFS
jgi:hypothetical protein